MPSNCSDAISGDFVSPGFAIFCVAEIPVLGLRSGFDAICFPFVNHNPDAGPDHPLAETEKSGLCFERCNIFAGYLQGTCTRTRIITLAVQQNDQPLLCYSVSGGWLQGHSVSRQGPLLWFLSSSRSHPFVECVIFSYGFWSPVQGNFKHPGPWNYPVDGMVFFYGEYIRKHRYRFFHKRLLFTGFIEGKRP